MPIFFFLTTILKKIVADLEEGPMQQKSVRIQTPTHYKDCCKVGSTSIADLEFVKKFTQARFLNIKLYPKVRKSQ